MRRIILLITVIWLASLSGAWSQLPATAPKAETTVRLVESIRVLRVARTLNLSSQQIEQIQPLLAVVQEILQQEKASADELWQQASAAIEAVCEAWEAGDPAPLAELDLANQASITYYQLRQVVDDRVAIQAGEIARLLTPAQRALIETGAQQQAEAAAAGASGPATGIATTLNALRFVRPGDYQVLRLAVALRLAEEVLPPDHGDYYAVVREIMGLADSVRQMTDAQYAQQAPQLAAVVAESLQLIEPLPAEPLPVPLNEYLLFVSSPLTAELLKTYVAAPPAEGGRP